MRRIGAMVLLLAGSIAVALAVAEVGLHPEKAGSLRRDLLRMVRRLRFSFPPLPDFQQDR